MAKSKTLKELLVTKAQALYDIESELVEALPTMAEAASDPELKEAFSDHLDETRTHVTKIERVLELLGEEPEKLKTDSIRGLVKDAEWLVKNVEEGDALDTALIAAARTVEHYEMSKYMAAQEWAEMLEEEQVSEILTETFEEEQNAEEKLAELAGTIVERLSTAEEGEEE